MDTIAKEIDNDIPAYSIVGQVTKPMDGTDCDKSGERQMSTTEEVMEAQAKDILCQNL